MKHKQHSNFLWALPWIIVTLIVIASSFGFGLINIYMSGNDGFDYADMGIHLIHGVGTFWSPQFTATRFIHFYEHPPVGLWYFALFFKIFGVHWYTDKIIACVNTIWTVTITLYFWRREFPHVSKWLAWVPIMLLFSNLFVTFYFASNKLECIEIPLSMTLLYWLTQSRYRQIRLSTLYLQAIIAGPICVVGFEINGMLFLYVWVAFILCRLTSKNMTWIQAILLTITMVTSTLISYGLLMGLVPAARHNNWMYWSTQLKPALLGKRTDAGHIYQGLRHILPLTSYIYYITFQVVTALAIWFILEWYGLKHFFKQQKQHYHTRSHHILFYVALCIVTSLPLLISTKDLSYYNLHTNTYLALLLSCIITPLCHQWSQQAPLKKKVYLIWVLMALTTPFLNWLQIHRINKIVAHNAIYESYLASSTIINDHLIPKHSIISMPPHILTHELTYTEPSFARFLDSGLLGGYDCKYLLTSIYDLVPIPKVYHLVPVNLGELALYERAHALPSCHPRVESMKEYHNFGLPTPFPM